MQTSTVTATGPALSDLAAEFPGWHVWRGRDHAGSDTDWHATRRARLAPRDAAAGLLARVSASGPASLHDLLRQQEAITRKRQS